ncbi:MAG: glycosyltransferase family 2 protein [Fimbriimonadaceae bacterium]
MPDPEISPDNSDAAPSVPAADSVAVVVVSFNTREKLRRCLNALPESVELIVVDNGSDDGSADMVRREFPDAALIANAENRGFGAANNQGIAAATRPLVLLLNSDAYAEPGALDELAAAFADPNVVAAGGRLLNPDRTLQKSTAGPLTLWAVFCEQTLLEKAFPQIPCLNPYWNTHRLDGPADVEQVMGACLMMRRGLETFDERFFLYCEDTELCRRLRRRGRIRYVPSAVFVHELGSSSSGERWRSVARYNRGKELYFAIHHGAGAAAACWILDRLGALIRLVGWLVPTIATLGTRPRFRSQAALFWRVLTAPPAGPPSPIRKPR